ncbi:hypothetical protein ACFPL7_23360 [Dongia soli]|uniref:Uncharacterized protein n=1 Tax=Dongia soli TaxID=600628 RepID=A0ABU5EHB7_9PROT|nr:hypothetical protein [Dongia soli]MDY0885687.1 hypothetical protein [Dongia soli]
MRRFAQPIPYIQGPCVQVRAEGSVRRSSMLSRSLLMLVLAGTLSASLPAVSHAQDVGDDLNAAGQSVKEGAKDTGHAIGDGARDVGHAIGEGARDTGHAIGEGASDAGHAIKEGAQDTGDFAKDKTQEARSGIGGFFHRVGNWFSGGE